MDTQEKFKNFTHLNQLIFPKAHLTKRDILNYYDIIGERILTYIKDKPLVVHYFPQSIDHVPTFKNPTDSSAGKIKKLHFKNAPIQEFLYINTTHELLSIVNDNGISFYMLNHNHHNMYHPDFMIFILEKDTYTKFNLLRWVGEKLNLIFKKKHISPLGMLNNENSLAFFIPLKGNDAFNQVRNCAFSIAHQLAQEYPEYITLDHNKKDSPGIIFIDTDCNRMQNTFAAPYTILPTQHAHVAFACAWARLARINPQDCTLKYLLKNNFFNHQDASWHNATRKSLFEIYNV